jgi:RHS repeat-associated protein
LGRGKLPGGQGIFWEGRVREREGGTNEYGVLEGRREYDVFGEPYEGDLGGGVSFGYTGKPYDAATGLYDYGYRDYKAELARFTTEDPIRDGSNWFAYANNDPVNYIDLWGLTASDGDWKSDVPGIIVYAPEKPDNYYDVKDISENLSKVGIVTGMVADIGEELGRGPNISHASLFSFSFNFLDFSLDLGISLMDPNPDTISDTVITAIGFVPILGSLASEEAKLTKKAVVGTARAVAEFNQSIKYSIKKDPSGFFESIINYFATYK